MTEFPVIDLSYKTDEIDLSGPDGNTFALAAIGTTFLTDMGLKDLKSDFTDELFSGDYENVLQTMNKWFALDLHEDDSWME